MSSTKPIGVRSLHRLAAEGLRKNAGQWKAYESKGNCVILAGPGSGKTKTLTIKLAKILAEDIRPPRGLACITYSNQCVRELRRRLSKLGVEEGRRVSIGTLHSFCLQHIVMPYARLAGVPLPEPINVATSNERDELWSEAISTAAGTDQNPRDWIFRCDLYRRTHIDRSDTSWNNDDASAVAVIEEYERILFSRGLVDFDGMVLLGLQLVEGNDWIRRALRARFPVLIVDEYQDLGKALHRLVLCLTFQGKLRLVAVGDPDQSIYGFSGAEPALLQELARHPMVESVRLQLNYRCGSTIIKASEAALAESRDFKSGNTLQGTIDIHHCPQGVAEQAAVICDRLIPEAIARRPGRKLGEIAVLYRNQYDGNDIAPTIEARGVEFIRIDQGNPYPRSPLIYWLEDCAAWCATGWKLGVPRLSELTACWSRFNESLASGPDQQRAQKSLVKFLFSHRDPNLPLHTWIINFKDKCLDETLGREPRLRDDRNTVRILTEVCSPTGRLVKFTVATFGGQGGSGNYLNLMTLHSAKGLEFDVVIMTGLEEGKMPDFRSKTDDRLREDRRLFYVGLTRARHEVHLLYSGWNKNKYGRRFDVGPSRFINEVRQAIL